MAEVRENLLTEPLLRIRSSDGCERTVSLPGALAGLGTEDVAAFLALQPHQAHAWHAFLVQLAGLALFQAGADDPVGTERIWAERLRALAGERSEAWCLLVEDLAQPAFMQPPVPEGSLNGFKAPIDYPDALDILVTSKNHDVKAARIGAPAAEHWVYALVTLQTMQGYSGRDNHGVVRMNGGFGNRPCVGFAPAPDWGARFLRDVGVLLASRADLVAGSYGYPETGGLGLLWLEPWDGGRSFPIQKCDPFFIEVCRRVRMEDRGGQLVARTAPSKAKRLAAAVDNGDTGDPWTPVKDKDGAALTLDSGGFTYRRLTQLLFSGDFHPGAAGTVRPDDADTLVLVAQAMARGQGKTEGLHQREVPIPKHVRYRLGRPGERQALAELAQRRMEQVAIADRKILHPALCVLLQAGPEKADFRDSRTQRWRERFDADVDRVFFSRLWEDVDLPPVEAERRWGEELRTLARARLDDAIESAPVPSTRHYRAVAAAERVFGGGFRKNFPQLYERSTDELEPTP